MLANTPKTHTPPAKMKANAMKTLMLTAALLLALSGCSSDDTTSPGEDYTPLSESDVRDNALGSDPAPDMADEAFTTLLKSQYPADFMSVDDETLISLGHSICEGYANGVSWDQSTVMALNAGYDPAPGGALLGASIAAYCPEYTDLMENS